MRMKVTTRSIILKLALSVSLVALMPLASCSTPSGTPTQPLTPPAMVETATATATAEAAGPSLDSIPAEWRGRIDRVETMTNMDGKTTRVVAIEKLTQEEVAAGETEARLRVLQWDGKEWVNYVPQVGWAGWGERGSGDSLIKSVWDEDIKLPDRDTLAEPLKYQDGSEVPMGWLGYTYFTGDPEGARIGYFQGYVLDVFETPPIFEGASDGQIAIYLGIPLETGDWEVYVSTQPDQESIVMNVSTLESLSPDDFGKDIGAMSMRPPNTGATESKLHDYLLNHGDELVGLPIIQGVIIDPGYENKNNSNEARVEFVTGLSEGEPVNVEAMSGVLTPLIIPEWLWDQMTQ